MPWDSLAINLLNLQAYVSTGAQESWSKVVLANTIVLRRIFYYLPLNALNECSSVNKLWNFEVRSYVRDFRQCNVNICETTPCASLHTLDQLVAQMSVVHYNGIRMILGRHSATPCVEKRTPNDFYTNLINNVPLRNLDLGVYWDSPDEEQGEWDEFGEWNSLDSYWDPSYGPRDCPAIKLMLALLHHKVSQLESLKFESFPSIFSDTLGPDWTPCCPKLKIFDVGHIRRTVHEVGFLNKILSGSPCLKKLKGYFDPELLGILPEDKYYLLDTFRVLINSDEYHDKCLKLAHARPALSTLFLNAPYESERQFERSFYHVTEQLLSSSCCTLVELYMNFVIFPLNRVTFPALINLETLNMTGTATAQQFLNAVNSIDFPKLLPNVKVVVVASGLSVYDDNDLGQPLFPQVNIDIPVCANQPSTTVEKLVLDFDVNPVGLQYFGRMFPNVKKIEVTPRNIGSTFISYQDLWTSWPHLESVELFEGTGALQRNFDAEFLGINPEEVQILRGESEEFLNKLNLVPIRPCILTLLGKKPSYSSFFGNAYL